MKEHLNVSAQDIIDIKPTAPPGLENLGLSLILAAVILVLTIVFVKAAKAGFMGEYQSAVTVIVVLLVALAGLTITTYIYWSPGSTQDVPILSGIGEMVRAVLFTAAIFVGLTAGLKRWR